MITLTFVVWLLVGIISFLEYFWIMSDSRDVPASSDEPGGCCLLVVILAASIAGVITWDINGFWAIFSGDFVLLTGSIALGLLSIIPMGALVLKILTEGPFHSDGCSASLPFSIIKFAVELVGFIASVLGIIQFFQRQ